MGVEAIDVATVPAPIGAHCPLPMIDPLRVSQFDCLRIGNPRLASGKHNWRDLWAIGQWTEYPDLRPLLSWMGTNAVKNRSLAAALRLLPLVLTWAQMVIDQ